MRDDLSIDEVLRHAASVAIAGHIKPDGDCVGSCLGLYNYIKDNFKELPVDVYLEPVPEKFCFLTGAGEIHTDCTNEKEYDVFFSLDCGDEKRLGEAIRYFKTAGTRICVDHHASSTLFADINYVAADASSTSELIYRLIGKDNVSVAAAECLYLGIAHDTGIFQYSCTAPETMEAAADLMRKQIDFSGMIDRTYYEKTFSQTRIMGEALADSELLMDGKVIYSVITQSQMEKYGADSSDMEGIVSQLRVTKGVDTAVFIYETSPGVCKVSFRSKCQVDVSKIAVELGGGGHIRAAGVTLSGTLIEMKEKILEKIRQQL